MSSRIAAVLGSPVNGASASADIASVTRRSMPPPNAV
jgi:hypothetical protein